MFIGWAWTTLTVVTTLSLLCGLNIDYPGWVELIAPALPPSVGVMYYANKIGWPRIAEAAECMIASLALVPTVIFSTFIATGLNMPLADGFLSSVDRMLGFDWLGLIHLLDQNRALLLALGAAYVSFSPQVFGIPLLLALTGQSARARQMLFCFGVVCMTASCLSILFPAAAAFATYAPQGLSNINPDFVNQFLPSFHAVRSDPFFILTPTNAEGVVTFPSVHAAVAILSVWGAWTLRWLRIPALGLNALMLLSTFSHGGHYLIDVLAGCLLAVVAIVVTSRLNVLQALFEPGVRAGRQSWKDAPTAPVGRS